MPGHCKGLHLLASLGEETIKLRTRMAQSDDTIEIEVTDRDAAAANKALELLGKTPELALFIDRHEHRGVDAFDAMSDDELRQYIAEEAKALGIHDPTTNGRGNGTKH